MKLSWTRQRKEPPYPLSMTTRCLNDKGGQRNLFDANITAFPAGQGEKALKEALTQFGQKVAAHGPKEALKKKSKHCCLARSPKIRKKKNH